MSRPLSAVTLVCVHISAVLSRERFTTTPYTVIDEVRAIAGGRVDVLAQEAGSWAGFYRDEHTAVLADALIREVPDASEWLEVGRRRREAGVHSAPYGPPGASARD